MFKEFKKFAMRGNVIDLAVGVIIGGAFNKIVSSLVKDAISPLIGLLLGKINLEKIAYTIPGTSVTIGIGPFLQSVIDFLIISFTIFVMIKAINKLKRKEEKEEEVKAAPVPTKEELLLAEIRDILKEQKN